MQNLEGIYLAPQIFPYITSIAVGACTQFYASVVVAL